MNKLIAGGTMAALALIAGGTAAAVVPAADGTIHGCVNQATGIVRVIDLDKPGNLGRCVTSGPAVLREAPLDWNQAGQPAPGPVLYERTGGGVNVDEQPYHLAMDLPAGAYRASLTFQVDNDSTNPAIQPVITCQLAPEGAPGYELRQSIDPVRGVELVSGEFTFQQTGAWRLVLDCPRTPGLLLHMSGVALRAEPVASINPG